MPGDTHSTDGTRYVLLFGKASDHPYEESNVEGIAVFKTKEAAIAGAKAFWAKSLVVRFGEPREFPMSENKPEELVYRLVNWPGIVNGEEREGNVRQVWVQRLIYYDE